MGSSPPPRPTTIVYLAPERADDRSRARRRAASVLRSRCFGIAPESVAGRPNVEHDKGRALMASRIFQCFVATGLHPFILFSARNQNAGMCVDGKGARTKPRFSGEKWVFEGRASVMAPASGFQSDSKSKGRSAESGGSQTERARSRREQKPAATPRSLTDARPQRLRTWRLHAISSSGSGRIRQVR